MHSPLPVEAEPIRAPVVAEWQVRQPLVLWACPLPVNGDAVALWQPTQLTVVGVEALLAVTEVAWLWVWPLK